MFRRFCLDCVTLLRSERKRSVPFFAERKLAIGKPERRQFLPTIERSPAN
jgi:hypothetical protein